MSGLITAGSATAWPDAEDPLRQMDADVRSGLSSIPKHTPCKYLYDARGSQLFQQICETPEYYPTRTEIKILEQSAADIMNFLTPRGGDLIELGSGSNLKIRRLLDAVDGRLRRRIRYVPVDISESCLLQSTRELSALHSELQVSGIVADFTCSLAMLAGSRRKMILFLGSTIGNFSAAECATFLTRVAAVMNRSDCLVLGMDMLKPVAVLERAYNDAAGLTAAFNLNLLRRFNRDLGTNFNLADFEHLAVFKHPTACIEMHLRARRDLIVVVPRPPLHVHFRQGETIHTETCRKFSRASALSHFRAAGLTPVRWFTDERQWFSVVILQKDQGGPHSGGSGL